MAHLRLAASTAVLACSVALPVAAQRLDAPRYYPDAEGGQFRAQGDLDADGDLDLIEVTGQGQTNWTGFRAHLNDGTGNLHALNQIAFPPTAFGIEFLARDEPIVADLDGDTHLDFITEHFASVIGGPPGIWVYRGDGTGRFPTEEFILLPGAPAWFEIGQIDADPQFELAVYYGGTNEVRAVAWFDWDGTQFVESGTLSMSSELDPHGDLRRMAPLDVDLDGDTDFFGTSATQELVRGLITVDGQLTFGSAWSLSGDFVNANVHVDAGDLDNDGDPDLLLTRPLFESPDYDAKLMVFENLSGALSPHPEQLVTQSPTTSVGIDGYIAELVDWDKDGFLDLCSGGGYATILRNRGDLTFEWGGATWIGGQSSEVGLGDMNGDGFVDALSSRMVLFGDGELGEKNIEFPAYNPNGFVEDYPILADWEDDGDVDLLGFELGGRWINDGTGELTGVFPLFGSVPGFSSSVAIGDFTGNGRLDYLGSKFTFIDIFTSQFEGMHLYVDDGTGTYVEGPPAAQEGLQISGPGLGQTWWPVGDADGDGDVDVLVNDGYWRNDGAGFFDFFFPTNTGEPLEAADLDGDGDADLVAQELAAGFWELTAWERIGGVYLPTVLATGGDEWVVKLLDIDADGDLDLIAGLEGVNGVSIFENEGGDFTLLQELDARALPGPAWIAHDANGDGLLDLYGVRFTDLVSNDRHTAGIYLRSPGGPSAYEDGEYYYIDEVNTYADFDGDGDIDARGRHLIDGLEHVEPDSGRIRQYGTGFPGTDGVVPVLGASGPVWGGSTTGALRVRDGLGGFPFVLLISGVEGQVADLPQPGMTLWVQNPIILPALPLGGTPLAAGEGSFDLPLPTDGALAGLRLFFQAYIVDPGSANGNWSNTNGVEVLFGS